MKILSPEARAKVWLEHEQANGFFLKVTLQEVMDNPCWFDEVENGHSKAVAQAQLEDDRRQMEGIIMNSLYIVDQIRRELKAEGK